MLSAQAASYTNNTTASPFITILLPCMILTSIICLTTPCALAQDEIYADVLCHYNPGDHVNTYYPNPNIAYNLPEAALHGPDATVILGYDPYNGNEPVYSTIVSLGTWTKTAPPPNESLGLTIGFSTAINNGEGNDLLVVGNAFDYSGEIFREPGFIEVARETTSQGATPDGWLDEAFYLIKPSNFNLLDSDPRLAPTALGFQYPVQPWYTHPAWQSSTIIGYADMNPQGDLINIDDAVDLNCQPVLLPDISYIRFRTISDDSLGPFGYATTEIDYIQALNGLIQPTPALPGDYNNDDIVDQADFTTWADSFGDTGENLPADGNGDGIVDQADFTTWADNFGQSSGDNSPSSVPEPGVLLLTGVGIIVCLRRRVRICSIDA